MCKRYRHTLDKVRTSYLNVGIRLVMSSLRYRPSQANYIFEMPIPVRNICSSWARIWGISKCMCYKHWSPIRSICTKFQQVVFNESSVRIGRAYRFHFPILLFIT